jgi:hypothetical protein
LAGGAQQTGSIQLLEMKRRVGGTDADANGDLAGRHARRALLHEQPKDAQAMLVRQCGQRSDDPGFIHAGMISRIIAIINMKFGALSVLRLRKQRHAIAAPKRLTIGKEERRSEHAFADGFLVFADQSVLDGSTSHARQYRISPEAN